MSTVLLEARDISFGYAPSAPLLESWSHEFLTGEVVALTGPSGRGKSTLLYLLGLMLRPQTGQLIVQGQDVTTASDRQKSALRAGTYGFVFQDAALDPGRTVLDNVLETALYRGEDRSARIPDAMALLDRFGVGLRATHKPGQISGGQAQRIAVCRALLHSPRILLCDEPTGNLDAASSRAVIDGMRHQADGGSAVIVATHDPVLMDFCDRRIEL